MRKKLLTLVFGLLVSITAMAQTNNEERAEAIVEKEVTKIEATLKFENKDKFTASKKALTVISYCNFIEKQLLKEYKND